MANDEMKQIWKVPEPTLTEVAVVSCLFETDERKRRDFRIIYSDCQRN